MDIGIGSFQLPTVARAAPLAAAPTTSVIVQKPDGQGDDKAQANSAELVAKRVDKPVEEAVTSIQNFVQNIRRDLSFSLDDSSGRVVVKVTDSASGEVIRQLPSEEALRLAESLEEARSLLFKAEA